MPATIEGRRPKPSKATTHGQDARRPFLARIPGLRQQLTMEAGQSPPGFPARRHAMERAHQPGCLAVVRGEARIAGIVVSPCRPGADAVRRQELTMATVGPR